MSASRCTISPDCQRGHHAPDAFPCGGPLIHAGDPCGYCGDPIQAGPDGALIPCPSCWRPITIADFRAVFAVPGLETTVTTEGTRL